jgi:hypothetical protein
MVDLHQISPDNEMRVAERLKAMIVSAWPDVADSARDRVDILVGAKVPGDVDILVILRLERPREVPPQRLRHGPMSPASQIQYALIAIEIKQLDQDRFDRVGNQLFPTYNGQRSTRSCSTQAADAAIAVSTFARQNGHNPFVYRLAWLTEVDDAFLQPIDPSVVGRGATWFGMLAAASQQYRPPAGDDPARTLRALFALRELLLTRRRASRRDRARIERLSRDHAGSASVRTLVSKAGSVQIRLIGRGGSGKTTSLALLAVALAEAGERVVFLTFHRTLRTDIASLVASLGRPINLPPDRIQVDTIMAFILSALTELGASIPLRDGQPDYGALDAVLDETRAMLVDDKGDVPGDVSRLRAANPERFAWDYVFIDEAQDCSDAERDFLRALYGHRRLILADGVDQLVRRQVACDWNVGIAPDERLAHRLDSSLRMLRNVALFATSFARALGLDTWRIDPQPDLPGGRIIIATGEIDAAKLLPAVVAAAEVQNADAADCLICLPPKSGSEDRVRDQLLAGEAASGISLWDGTLAENRWAPPSANDALRMVRYDSCRGLEGWITVALEFDQFANNRLKYPNLSATDAPIDPHVVLNRWLLIPVTRAVHTLVITLRDGDSFLAQTFREAAADEGMPRGVVEFVDASKLPGILASPRNDR